MSSGTLNNNLFHHWFSRHTTTLTSFDPDAPLDDLEPLRDIIGHARVVAIGESSHFIREFWLMRQRILRFLVERCDFQIFGGEFGFSEGISVDAWVCGAGADDNLNQLVKQMLPLGFTQQLRWLRQYNAHTANVVRFAGVDIPAAGGSLLPALNPVIEYIRKVDPESVRRLEDVLRIACKFAGTSMAVASPQWARLEVAEQNALTSMLTRLLIRFRALEFLYVRRSDQLSYDIALRQLEAACFADYHLSAMANLYDGCGLTADTTDRELYMAESVQWHLNHTEPSAHIVLEAHNAHIQKTPVSYDGRLSVFPMGQHIKRMIGNDYCAIALTSTSGQTADMTLDEKARFGFTIKSQTIPKPQIGSIERAFIDAQLGLAIADLRKAPRDNKDFPYQIQMQGCFLETSLPDAFDAVINIPNTTIIEDALQ